MAKAIQEVPEVPAWLDLSPVHVAIGACVGAGISLCVASRWDLFPLGGDARRRQQQRQRQRGQRQRAALLAGEAASEAEGGDGRGLVRSPSLLRQSPASSSRCLPRS
jgi:hypothetical protein